MHPSVWLFLPTYNEAENLEAIVRATTAAARGGRARRLAPAGGRRRLPGRHRRSSPTGWPRSSPASRCCTAQGKEGLGPAYLAGFEHALERGAELVIVMDADFSHDPAPPAGDDRRRPATATSCSGSRYVAGGEITNWPPAAPRAEPQRLALRAPDARRQGARPDHRLPLRTPARARDGRALDAALAGLRLQHRADLPRAAGRLQRRRRSRSASAIARRARARCRSRSRSRRCRLVPKLRGLRTEVVEQRSNGARAQPPRALALAALAAPPRGHPGRSGRRPGRRARPGHRRRAAPAPSARRRQRVQRTRG